MPGRSNVNFSEGTKTLTCERGRIPRAPRNVSSHRFEPYARYSTVLAFSSVGSTGCDASVFASNGASVSEASRRACDSWGTLSNTTIVGLHCAIVVDIDVFNLRVSLGVIGSRIRPLPDRQFLIVIQMVRAQAAAYRKTSWSHARRSLRRTIRTHSIYHQIDEHSSRLQQPCRLCHMLYSRSYCLSRGYYTSISANGASNGLRIYPTN